MGRVFGQDGPQVPFTEDQHVVGDLGPGGAHKSFRVGVRPRGARRVGAITSWMSKDGIGAAYRARFAGFTNVEDERARLTAAQLSAFGPYRQALAVVCLVPDRPASSR